MVKVNLLIDNAGGARDGYLNIDVFTPEGDPARVKGDVSNLDHLVDDGEATEIVAHDVIQLFDPSRVDAILDGWIRKLAHGGTLTISTSDLREVARGFLAGILSLEQTNHLLYGTGKPQWRQHRSCLSLLPLCEVLESKGLTILLKRVSNWRMVATAQRP